MIDLLLPQQSGPWANVFSSSSSSLHSMLLFASGGMH
jgi:hypothetical protein